MNNSCTSETLRHILVDLIKGNFNVSFLLYILLCIEYVLIIYKMGNHTHIRIYSVVGCSARTTTGSGSGSHVVQGVQVLRSAHIEWGDRVDRAGTLQRFVQYFNLHLVVMIPQIGWVVSLAHFSCNWKCQIKLVQVLIKTKEKTQGLVSLPPLT